jgi:hypothetical protein
MRKRDENLERQCARLLRHRQALEALTKAGLHEGTIARFNLGLKASYQSRTNGEIIENALSFPILGADGQRLPRFAFVNLEGVTIAPPHPGGWGVGSPLSYWSTVASRALPLLVVEDPPTLWLVEQLLDATDAPERVILTRSHGPGAPMEWVAPSFWRDWPSIVWLGEEHPRFLGEAAQAIGREFRVAPVPEGFRTWRACLAAGLSRAELEERISSASAWIENLRLGESEDETGEFAYEPIDVATAFLDGNLFYPYVVEERSHETTNRRHGELGGLVQRYAIRVVRSDGAILKINSLPMPKGSRDSSRVYALSDGTRIAVEPTVSPFASWSFNSIRRFVDHARSGQGVLHRPPTLMAGEIEAHLRGAVWLPNPDSYALLTTYVMLTYVYQVFDAVPLLLVNGPKGTGKTELGQALADLSCNAVLVGQASAAGLIRLMNETRGLIVLDDLEQIGAALGSGFSEVAQMLKLSYKKASANKPVAERGRSVARLDFFGPKVVTNTLGADRVLGSRMVCVTTASVPKEVTSALDGRWLPSVDTQRLRDELHSWGMKRAVDLWLGYEALPAPRCRREEIEAPLLAVASHIGGDWPQRLRAGMGEPLINAAKPALERVRDAVLAIAPGERVTIQQLQLELALSGGVARPISPEAIGRLLVACGFRLPRSTATRLRLNGTLVRIIDLDGPSKPPVVTDIQPLSFCREQKCSTCRYLSVCPTTTPELHRGKRP